MECVSNCCSNFRKIILRCCFSCFCHTDGSPQDRGSFYRPIRQGQFTLAVVEYRPPARHRYAPCSPRYSGPETLEQLCKAIESLERMNERDANPADGDGKNIPDVIS